MAISTQSFATIVQNSVTAVQGTAKTLVDPTVGSVLRAFLEANAAIALWLQGLVMQVAALTRFATSSGSNADSWAADYGFTRLPAQAAQGSVTFSRFTNTTQAVIPVGSQVQTADGTQKYTVIADTTQTAYNSTLNAYVIAAGTSSANATVQAVNTAAASNAVAGFINTLSQSIPYVDTVTNAAGFTNGSDPESDAAFRTRFVAYIASLSKATKTAIGTAITSLQIGLVYTLTENFTYAGSAQQGYFYVVVDDGSGSPSGTLLASVTNAVDAARPVGTSFAVFAPVVVTANVAMTITTSSGYIHSAIVTLVQAAIAAYVNTLPLGTSLTYTRLAQIAYDASPAVTNVTGVTLNSATADLTATAQQVIKLGTNSVV